MNPIKATFIDYLNLGLSEISVQKTKLIQIKKTPQIWKSDCFSKLWENQFPTH